MVKISEMESKTERKEAEKKKWEGRTANSIHECFLNIYYIPDPAIGARSISGAYMLVLGEDT